MNCDRRVYIERMKSEKNNLKKYRAEKVILEDFWDLIKYGR